MFQSQRKQIPTADRSNVVVKWTCEDSYWGNN